MGGGDVAAGIPQPRDWDNKYVLEIATARDMLEMINQVRALPEVGADRMVDPLDELVSLDEVLALLTDSYLRWSEAQTHALIDIFHLFDTDRSGGMEYREFEEMMRFCVGRDASDRNIVELFKMINDAEQDEGENTDSVMDPSV